MARHRTQNCAKRDGYVLIMVLVLIAIAAISLAGLARKSLLLAGEAIEAQHELQRRWGANSCRRMLLDQAGEIFEQAEQPYIKGDLPWPAPSKLTAEIQLGGMNYRLWLSDEDAKLNLNRIKARLPQQSHQIFSQLMDSAVPFQLRPDTSQQAKRQRRWFLSWGQVFNLTQVWESGSLDSLMDVTSTLTCWGSKKINIRRASEASIMLVSSKMVSQEVGRKLIEARSEATDLTWANLVKPLALKRKDELKLRAWFTDDSSCYCLWLELEDKQRRWYHQWILGDPTSTAQDPVLTFSW